LDSPDPAALEAMRRILRVKRFESAALAESLPGRVRRGARVDLEPLAAALGKAGIRCEFQRSSEAAGSCPGAHSRTRSEYRGPI